MKRLVNLSIRVVRQNYVSMGIFLILLFRPQILYWIRHHVVKPIHKKCLHAQPYSSHRVKLTQAGMPVVNAGLVRSTESDDGCGDDGSCTEEDDSETDTEEDYSADEGCNDDGGCETEDDSYYTESDDPYSDDGCSCAGETAVTSSGSTNSYYFNSTLRIKLNISGTVGTYKLYVNDSAGNVLITFFRNTMFGNGVYYYSWDGNYGQGQFVSQGYYKVVFEAERSPYSRFEKNFYYSTVHGFEVDGTAGNVAEIIQ